MNKPRLFYHSVLSVCQEFQRRSIVDSRYGLGGGVGRGLGVVWSLGVGVGLGDGVALPEAVAVAVAVAVGVGVDGWYIKLQVTSGVPPILQLKALGGICMTLRPGTAGDVLKWKIMPE